MYYYYLEIQRKNQNLLHVKDNFKYKNQNKSLNEENNPQGTEIKEINLQSELIHQKLEVQDINQQRQKSQSQLQSDRNQQKDKQFPKIAKLIKSALQDDKKSHDNEQRLKQYREFLLLVNLSNNLYVKQTSSNFKIYIAKGNNFQIISSAFKRRWWWSIYEYEPDDCSAVWTQIRKANRMEYLVPKNKCNKKIFQLVQQKLYDENLQKIFGDLGYQENYRTFQSSNITKCIQLRKNQNRLQEIENSKLYQYNHLDQNFHLSNKKTLFSNIQEYCELHDKDAFDYLPVTFNFSQGMFKRQLDMNPDYQAFLKYYREQEKSNFFQLEQNTENGPKNIFIIKPGEDTNRGNGIMIAQDLSEIKNILNQNLYHKNGTLQTFIIQQYIENPLLYNKRKFDIRCFVLITSVNGNLKAYWFETGYIRTSSKIFNLSNIQDRFIHLTNDAIQKYSDKYGKFEHGNKVIFQQQLGYKDYQNYLNANKIPLDFEKTIVPKMKEIATIAINAVQDKIDRDRKSFSFEVFYEFQIFGLDYMIDSDFKTYLIEFNTNPCLETTCSLLAYIIPTMIEHAIRIAVDPIFPPPETINATQLKFVSIPDRPLQQNKFHLIYDDQYKNEPFSPKFFPVQIPKSPVKIKESHTQKFFNVVK